MNPKDIRFGKEMDVNCPRCEEWFVIQPNVTTVLKARDEEIDKKLRNTIQFACLESWCKSRGKGSEYCRNCKDRRELGL